MVDCVQRYMLDTNTASYIIKGQPVSVRKRLVQVPMASICISSITEAELLHGVARKPEARKLPLVVKEFLIRVDILPWDSEAAGAYAQLRTACEIAGTPLASLDMLIAAHAVAVGATLVTSDQAFFQLAHHLTLENWAE